MSDLGFQPHEEVPATDAPPRRSAIGAFVRWEVLLVLLLVFQRRLFAHQDVFHRLKGLLYVFLSCL